MEVVRLPIAFKGLGRSLFLHEDDVSESYTLTIPDFDLFQRRGTILAAPRVQRPEAGALEEN